MEMFALDSVQSFSFNTICGGSTHFDDSKDYFIVGMYRTDKQGERLKGGARRNGVTASITPPELLGKLEKTDNPGM